MVDYDVVTIGAGVAGLASVIAGGMRGLRCAVVAQPYISRNPGEVIDGTAQQLFRQLGVESHIAAAEPTRLLGHYVRRGQITEFVSHSSGAETLVLAREKLEEILRRRAIALGVDILSCTHSSLCVDKKQPKVIVDGRGLRTRFLVDASGRRRVLARALGLLVEKHSPFLMAFYGYRSRYHNDADEPIFESEVDGWTWTAPSAIDEMAIVRLTWGVDKKLTLHELKRDRRWRDVKVKAADVSWRIVSKPAGPGYFIVGDAACVLDPGSGNGIVRALQGGFISGSLAAATLGRAIDEAQAQGMFNDCIWRQFERDKMLLSGFYGVADR